MNSQPFVPPRILAAGAALAFLLLAAGCASDDDQPRPRHGAAAKPRHFPTLAGQETFFNGTITAEVLVGAMTGFNPDGGEGSSGGGGRHHGGLHGGGGGGRRHGGEGEPEGPPPGAEGGDADSSGSSAIRHAEAMGSPPVMIHLRFTNNGHEHADLVVADFLSPLGNFVVQPEKLSLEAGQSAEVEPMTSRLAGEVTGGDITLELKHAGATETKTIALALKPEAAPASPPATSEPAK